jgi:hypothetical protein
MLEFWGSTLNLSCAKMLIQTRRCLEEKNLKWNSTTNKYEFTFDPSELNQYAFIDSAYLGKEKICVVKESNEKVSLDKASVIINNARVKKEYEQDYGSDIISFLKQIIKFGIVGFF